MNNREMRVLVITSLFPNNSEASKGIYNKQQIVALSKLCSLIVIAPVPWSPQLPFLKKWRCFTEVVSEETIDGIRVYHPRFLVIPKIGRTLYGFLFFISLWLLKKKIIRNFNCDLIYAPWAYPDGVGSEYIARCLGVPIVTGVLGSDVNVYSKFFLRRLIIADSLKRNSRVIAVSSALKQKVLDLGVYERNVRVLLNGVDVDVFRPADCCLAKEKLGLFHKNKHILFVGNFYPIKGPDVLLEAFALVVSAMSDTCLVFVGDGELRDVLIRRAEFLGISDKVVFAGRKPHNQVVDWINGCDVLCLPSINEGCPNVILESFACGKPVVASEVGGVSELLLSDDYGLLVPPSDHIRLSDALQYALTKNWNRNYICKRVRGCSWKDNALFLYNEFNDVLNNEQRR